MSYTVYKHTTPNGKVYIGITKQEPAKRWLNGKGYQNQEYFYNAILKYGWKQIKHEILFRGLTKPEAEEKEIELIKIYDSTNREKGYNIARGGHVNNLTEESIEKIRLANVGKKHNPKTCKRLSELEAKRWENPEYRENQIKKRLGKTPWNKGKETSAEAKEKQRKAKLGKYKGAKHWNSLKVINLDTGKIYNSFGEIAEELHIKNASHIVEVCKKKRAKAYGSRWAYYKKEVDYGDQN